MQCKITSEDQTKEALVFLKLIIFLCSYQPSYDNYIRFSDSFF